MSKLQAYIFAILAYLTWGLSPIYFKSLGSLSPIEIIIHRVVWSALCCGILLVFMKEKQWWKPLLAQPKYIAVLFFTGSMLCGNWLLYVWAINNHYILDASLGYYINPLLSVGLGTLILKERMSKLQLFAIALAIIGVMIQIILMGKLPWISLLLGMSFALYGLIRKVIPIKVLPGMMVETWILVPFALVWLWFGADFATKQSGFWPSGLLVLCMLAGPITLLPLILFNTAAKVLPYSTIGFLQYTAPTLIFILAIFYFNEQFHYEELVTFGFIWVALIIFSFDMSNIVEKCTRIMV